MAFSVQTFVNLVLVCVAALVYTNIRPYRAHNFSAGPGRIFDDVLTEVQQQLLSWEGSGMSMMEMSHRDADGPVQTMMKQAESDIRELLNVPKEYHVFFMHGTYYYVVIVLLVSGDDND